MIAQEIDHSACYAGNVACDPTQLLEPDQLIDAVWSILPAGLRAVPSTDTSQILQSPWRWGRWLRSP